MSRPVFRTVVPALMPMNDSEPSKPERRWYQFRLRTLLIFVLVVGMGLGWLGSKVQPIRNELNAMGEIQRMGGTVIHGVSELSSGHGLGNLGSRLRDSTGFERWLRRQLGGQPPLSR